MVIDMNKIRKYLESLGLELKYDKYYRAKHIGGRSFYNDGTYEVEVYQIVGTEYYIHHKSSGRPLYYLYKNKNCDIYTGRFSQQDFITVLEEVLKREKIVG